MIRLKPKITIITLCSCLAALALAVVLLFYFLLTHNKATPHSLLTKADTLSEQNLCLTAILQEDPNDEKSRRQLLINYQILGADPLTIEGSKQGLNIELPAQVDVQPEEPGSLFAPGGIIQNNIKLTDYSNANAIATDGKTVYLTTSKGIVADYHGLQILLTPAKAERMIAAQNGLYYLNAFERRVQYIARDGHKTQTLSDIAAVDFAWLDGTLWIAGADGTLYKDGVAIETPVPIEELCIAGDTLYGANSSEGLLRIGQEVRLLLPSPVCSIVGDPNGNIFYIDVNGYPAKFESGSNTACILKEKTALALGYSEGKLYYLTRNKKIKRAT